MRIQNAKKKIAMWEPALIIYPRILSQIWLLLIVQQLNLKGTCRNLVLAWTLKVLCLRLSLWMDNFISLFSFGTVIDVDWWILCKFSRWWSLVDVLIPAWLLGEIRYTYMAEQWRLRIEKSLLMTCILWILANLMNGSALNRFVTFSLLNFTKSCIHAIL